MRSRLKPGHHVQCHLARTHIPKYLGKRLLGNPVKIGAGRKFCPVPVSSDNGKIHSGIQNHPQGSVSVIHPDILIHSLCLNQQPCSLSVRKTYTPVPYYYSAGILNGHRRMEQHIFDHLHKNVTVCRVFDFIHQTLEGPRIAGKQKSCLSLTSDTYNRCRPHMR